tara:strand:+ start:69305 stop:69718 length:414 start_codon:yes stop_codon:yes gene_type:complete
MYSFKTNVRVRYAETDQMGFVYYGVYAQYYEVGRVELLRSLGLSYSKIEDLGFFLPVVNLEINYKKSAFYDNDLTIKTTVKEIPRSKITFFYEIFNQSNDLLNYGSVTLVFMNKKTNKICTAPKKLIERLSEKFDLL